MAPTVWNYARPVAFFARYAYTKKQGVMKHTRYTVQVAMRECYQRVWDLSLWVRDLSNGFWEDGSVNAELSMHKPNEGVFVCCVVWYTRVCICICIHVCMYVCKTNIWSLPQLLSTSLTETWSLQITAHLSGQRAQSQCGFQGSEPLSSCLHSKDWTHWVAAIALRWRP